ncbi:hypothetical protein SAY86_006174 [Trapa natans]|uniref:Protein SIEVE ELEMENT OCCLUSION B-like n=1 Tax=Trapa natans TaxID=22666 RepID=A0AAN7L452_TRANT|nr:hypothetical protein SAY86_006174 [Trapa natans]
MIMSVFAPTRPNGLLLCFRPQLQVRICTFIGTQALRFSLIFTHFTHQRLMDSVAPLIPPPLAVARKQLRPQKSGDRSTARPFSASDDSAMMKQIQATHAPDGRTVDVGPILSIIEGIFSHAAPSIDDVLNRKHDRADRALMEEEAAHAAYDGILEHLAFTIHRISCELSCKCTSGGGGDAHGTTMAIFNLLSAYSWDVKVVLALAAFAVNYGEFSLIANLYTTNVLAKSVSILKQLPDILENSTSLKPQFDALHNLIAAMVNVTKCILQFRDLPPQYIAAEAPPLSTAMTYIPTAAYWTIRSIVACASQVASLVGLGHEYMPSGTEAWELSSMAYKVNNIHDHLMTQLTHCKRHIDDKMHAEAYHNLLRLFDTYHVDNMKVLKALIYAKDDILPLYNGSTKTRVGLEALRKRTVLLLISDLGITHDDIFVLEELYADSRERKDTAMPYDIVWLPMVAEGWNGANVERFVQLRGVMPWHSVHHPSVIEPYVAKFIREVWHFANRTVLVALDPQGKVASLNAMYMIWIWRNSAFPFTKEREEDLWNGEVWRLELIVDGFDPKIVQWMADGKYICLYGGDNIEWIRSFTAAAKNVAKEAGIALELAYMGKNNAKERARKTAQAVVIEKLSYTWDNPTLFWYFWTRLESMLYSKLQHGKSTENDQIMQEVMTVLSYDGSDKGWAIFCLGMAPGIARAKGDAALESLRNYPKWEAAARRDGIVPALKGHLEETHSPHHCSRLILPGLAAGVPESVICAECGRPMERFIMYRCCIE